EDESPACSLQGIRSQSGSSDSGARASVSDASRSSRRSGNRKRIRADQEVVWIGRRDDTGLRLAVFDGSPIRGAWRPFHPVFPQREGGEMGPTYETRSDAL